MRYQCSSFLFLKNILELTEVSDYLHFIDISIYILPSCEYIATHLMLIFYHPQTKLREGYVFTGVCDSVQGEACMAMGEGACMDMGGGHVW